MRSHRTTALGALGLVLLVTGLAAAYVLGGRADDERAAATVTVTDRAASAPVPRTGFDVDAAARAVVAITVTGQTGLGQQQGTGSGSGFVLDRQGRIVTSEHVVDGASSIHVAFSDGTKATAELVATDPLLDLAVIRVDVPAAVLHPLPLGRAETLDLGDPVVAIGNPFGLDRSVSVGAVSAVHRQITAPNGFSLSNAIQTDAAVNHGNSGGPLLDEAGRVVGVNAQIAESGVDANVGVAFAVAIDVAAREAIARLATGANVEHAWLGVALAEIDALLATSGEVAEQSGALLTGIVEDGPADDAGLHGGTGVVDVEGGRYCLGGDIVVAAGGTAVRSAGDLQRAIAATDPGEELALRVVRADGSDDDVTVVLGVQPTSAPEATTGCG